MMQQPTCINTHVYSSHDALKIFYGVALDLLPIIERRLDAEERRAIASGNVYVWQDRAADSSCNPSCSTFKGRRSRSTCGFERWTDGISWGPSRIRDEFFFYLQKEPQNDSYGRRSMASHQIDTSQLVSGVREDHRLVKQTYSAYVTLPQDDGAVRKWHMTAYYTTATLPTLQAVDSLFDNPLPAIPQGWFNSARVHSRGSLVGKEDEISSSRIGHSSFLWSNQVPICHQIDSVDGSSASEGGRILQNLSYPLAPEDFSLENSYKSGCYHVAAVRSVGPSVALTPLSGIKSAPVPPRDPFDQQLLRRFTPLAF